MKNKTQEQNLLTTIEEIKNLIGKKISTTEIDCTKVASVHLYINKNLEIKSCRLHLENSYGYIKIEDVTIVDEG